MKLISNFELLVNRIAPVSSGAIARKVIQGHFLTISNTELHRSVYFKIKYTYGNFITNATGIDTDRELRIATAGAPPSGGNAVLIYDGGSFNNETLLANSTTLSTGVNIPGGNYDCVTTKNLRLRAGETGLLALLPFFQVIGQSPIQNSLTDLTPSVEVRGFISIEQVAESTYTNSNNTVVTETNPFVHEKANLILCSEHRGTFIDEDFNGTTQELLLGGVRVGFDFDQLAYALPLAEGKSLYTLDGV